MAGRETQPEFVVDWPTLFVAVDWVPQHCIVPDKFRKGQRFEPYEWQAWCLLNFYRVKPDAVWVPDNPILAPAFHYRRSQVILPQKAGKAPYTAAQICLQGVGPALFAGWAEGGETYDCRDHGCGCGWVYEYEPGEAMGMPWPTPLIQITAFSQEQTDNVYDALRPMIDDGPLHEMIPKTGEEFIRLPGGGRIDVVTSSAQSRLGQRVTFVPQDEALALDTPLPTPTGWTTMGDVQPGDQLLGADGRPATVTKATDVQHGRRCYRVTFSDNTSMVTSDGHLWQTKIAGSHAKPAVRTTGEMLEDGRRFRVPAPAPYELGEADLPVHPYVLGLWLGDGATGAQEITAHRDEALELQGHLAAGGVDARIRWSTTRAPTLCMSRKAGYQGALRPTWAKALSALPCYRDKHIPTEYLRASRAQREALLQGLMDSDGHVTETGCCTFAGNAQLAADMVLLLRTLGIQASAVSRADARARTGFGWKVNFTPRCGLQPFRLARKTARVRQAWVGCDWVSIVDISPCPSVPVRCVAVNAEDRLFLAGVGGHVTHNTGIWTEQNKMIKVAETQRRGLAGMGGRAEETTNAPDPTEDSVALRTLKSAARDVFRYFPQAPKSLSFKDKRERRKIMRHVYGSSLRDRGGHIDLDSIEAEALELMELDPGQAERFFGNRSVAGTGHWCDVAKWVRRAVTNPRLPAYDTQVTLGMDGSDTDDWTAIRAETQDSFQFTPVFGSDKLPTIWNPRDYGGQVPRLDVWAALDELFTFYRVVRGYFDPPYWETEIDEAAARWGDQVVLRFATWRIVQMHAAAERLRVDVVKADSGFSHDGCPITEDHVGNARRAPRPSERYVLVKASPPQKIDASVASVLAHEAACDATAADLWLPDSVIYTASSTSGRG